MNCHSVVKTDSPHIQKIKKAYDEGKAIEWVRIHELPDHAHFPHKRHVAKGISCQTCHGPVETMDVVYQYAPLNMGWCLNCHKGDSAPKHVLKSTYPDDKNPKGPVASVSCSVCHY
ncbi:MAG: cytochrome c3 family protein [Bdellovibrionales bacterium]|nr:cytochrome c3 family protein [Bdellovibrionales bacterium]